MGVLSGVRVVEISSIGPGPMAAMLLAQMGATVTRIGREETTRRKREPRFDLLYSGRPLVPIDLKEADGRAKFFSMIESADVLIEGFRPGVCERIGIGPAECLGRNPGLIYGRMTGWGQTGPLATTAGHDINYLALTGALHAIGVPGRPVPPLNVVGDFGGGSLYLALGIAGALFARSRTGKGQVIDAAIVDGTASLLTLFFGLMGSGEWNDRRGSNLLDGGCPVYDVYETADRQHMAVGCLEPQFYRTMVETLGIADRVPPPGAHMERDNWPALRATLETTFAAHSRAHWSALFEKTDSCVTPVLSLTEAVSHPHNRERRYILEQDGVRVPQPAPRFRDPTAEA